MIIKNLWKEVVPVCGRCNKPFTVPDNGMNLVYKCENHFAGTCNNQFSADDYFKIMEKLSSDFAREESDKSIMNFTGHSFNVRHLECKVISHEKEKITLSVVNKKKA